MSNKDHENAKTLEHISYSSGFNSYHQTEADPNTLPKNQNSPQKVTGNLYAEQLSGSAFTTTREHTKLTWCYRIQPSVVHAPFVAYHIEDWASPPFTSSAQAPNQYRWSPLAEPTKKINFINSIKTIAGFGDPRTQQGASASVFYANHNMSEDNHYFSNNDAEMLIVMQSGTALIRSELGILHCSADKYCSEIIVIPKGIRFQVDLLSEVIQGYICENFGQPFQLPELGLIGSNGLANPRHFLYPTAAYEKNSNNSKTWICKYQGNFWQAALNHSPCNVVAWHGNYAPYKYDLSLFTTLNTVSFDHPDPSIFTVLTSPSLLPNVANIDFVIFPPRWMVAEHTFRPPYFHRNIMSEFMGLIRGKYDAKNDGFFPGGASLHNRMSAHGPDYNSVLAAERMQLKPEKYENNLAFMFESNMAWDVTKYAFESSSLQSDYYKCWENIPNRYL